MVIMLPKGRTILSMQTVTLWTELWRIDLHKTYLNRYDWKSIEFIIGLVCFVGLNRYYVQVLFSSPEFELNTRFASSNLTLK